MKKIFAARHLFAFAIIGIAVFVAACRGPAPTSTPVPPTVQVPTSLPPAPTAPPLTEAPTAVLPTQAPPPAATEANVANPTTAPTEAPANPPATTASNAPQPTAAASNNKPAPTVDRGPLTGLYVAGLRYEPDYPRRNDPVMFYATLINQTGKDQHYPVCAEIFHPGAAKSFGITNCDTLTIVPGTSQVFIGSWIGTGIKECIPVRARVVLHEHDTDNVRLVFTTTRGGELWTDFQVCP